MSYAPKLLYPTGFPDTGGTVLYSLPTGRSAIIKNIVLTNTADDEAAVTLHIVQAGDTPKESNRILSSYVVPQSGISTIDCSIVMESESSIVGYNEQQDSVSLTISGVEII